MSIVALSFGDCFVHLAHDEHGPVLRADANRLGAEALFERVDLCHGRVALLTAEGLYLASRPPGTAAAGVRPEAELTACAAFEEVAWPDGTVSFRTCDRTFLGVDGRGLVLGDRISGGSCERFGYAEVPAELEAAYPSVPPQSRAAEEPRPTVLT